MLPLQVGQVPALEAGQVVLQSGVRVGVAVSKLVYIVLSVEAEGKGHDIVAPVVRAAVVVHVFGWKPLPATTKDKTQYRDIREVIYRTHLLMNSALPICRRRGKKCRGIHT